MALVSSYPAVTISGTVTSWLPVTTSWSAPAACSTIVWEGYPPYLALNDPGYGIYVDPGVKCLPPQATSWWEQNHSSNRGTTTFNLGPIVCPSAYTTATTSIQDSSTFVACCPSSYSLYAISNDGGAGQCRSAITVGQEISLVTYKAISNTNEVASAWVTTIYTVTSADVINAVHMNGWNFVPASTTSTSSSSTASTSTTTSSTTTGTTSSTATPAAAPADNSARNVGIGVGVSLGAVGILSAIFAIWFVRRRRQAANQLAGPPQEMPTQPWGGYAGGGPGESGKYVYHQTPGQYHEMQASKAYQAHEMEEPAYVGELDGTQGHRY